MKRFPVSQLFGLLLAMSSPAWAQPPSKVEPPLNPVLGAMQSEMARTMSQLRMDRLSKPYFVSYYVRQGQDLNLHGVFGAMSEDNLYPVGWAKVQVRVGGPDFDNTHFIGRDYWDYYPVARGASFESNNPSLRFSLWSLTDQAYKQALERFSSKRAYQQSRMISDKFPDLSKAPRTVSEQKLISVDIQDSERGLLRQNVQSLSAVFRDFPLVRFSEVDCDYSRNNNYFLNSEGSRSISPITEVRLEISADAQAKDGMKVAEKRVFVASSPTNLPSAERLLLEARSVGEDVSNLVAASTGSLYVGPVLFENQASLEFFNQLLAHNLSFPNAIWTENDEDKKYFETGALVNRVGIRVASSILNVVDDPTLSDYRGRELLGHYAVDNEGVPAEKVSLIEHGILKNLLMSRAPVKDHGRSNGHGRANFYDFPSGRIGNLIVRSDKTAKFSDVKGEFLRLCREEELEYCLVIRRLWGEDRRESDHLLAPPAMVYKIRASDGHEELLRDMEFGEVTLRALRDVLLTSDEEVVFNFIQLGSSQRNRVGTLASIVAPSAVLVEEMELKPSEEKPKRLPYLKSPFFDKTK